MKLYEINEQLEELLEALDYAEDTGEVQSEIDSLKIERDEKIENVGLYIKSLKADAIAIKTEEKALAERRKVIENKQKRLENWLQYALDGNKFKTAKLVVSYRKSVSVVIDDINALDLTHSDLVTTKTVTSANKTAIKEYLKDNDLTGMAHLEESQNMQVK